MKTERHECGNVDSCTPGTSHLYPTTDETVTLLFGQSLHAVGEETDDDFNAGTSFEVVDIDPEGHHIMGSLGGRRFWVPIDDIDWPPRSEIEELA